MKKNPTRTFSSCWRCVCVFVFVCVSVYVCVCTRTDAGVQTEVRCKAQNSLIMLQTLMQYFRALRPVWGVWTPNCVSHEQSSKIS